MHNALLVADCKSGIKKFNIVEKCVKIFRNEFLFFFLLNYGMQKIQLAIICVQSMGSFCSLSKKNIRWHRVDALFILYEIFKHLNMRESFLSCLFIDHFILFTADLLYFPLIMVTKHI